ncbi:hypothetical protein AK833_04835 [Lysinibacillus sp. F5]|nr:hypothetical protein AK833_04835 [Lysinibacillus sp. F5]
MWRKLNIYAIPMCLCRCKRKAWYAMDNLKRSKKIVHAGDAYFCCHEFKETGYLDVASSLREQLSSKSMLNLVVYYQMLKIK